MHCKWCRLQIAYKMRKNYTVFTRIYSIPFDCSICICSNNFCVRLITINWRFLNHTVKLHVSFFLFCYKFHFLYDSNRINHGLTFLYIGICILNTFFFILFTYTFSPFCSWPRLIFHSELRPYGW